jgi:hypothetical protein
VVCFQVETEKGIVIKRNIGQLATDIEAAAERSSKSRLSGQQTIMEGFTVASSSALSSAIANLIHCHGLHFTLSGSRHLAEVIQQLGLEMDKCAM